MNLLIKSHMQNEVEGNCAVAEQPFGAEASCGIDLSTALEIEPIDSANERLGVHEPIDEFGQPVQDWFEMALKTESPTRPPVRNSWGEDEEEGEDELPGEEGDEEEQDPFEDFDEDDFDDDFDDDFEEELDDEYEIEPADDGLVTEVPDDDLDDVEILDEDEEVDPGIDE